MRPSKSASRRPTKSERFKRESRRRKLARRQKSPNDARKKTPSEPAKRKRKPRKRPTRRLKRIKSEKNNEISASKNNPLKIKTTRLAHRRLQEVQKPRVLMSNHAHPTLSIRIKLTRETISRRKEELRRSLPRQKTSTCSRLPLHPKGIPMLQPFKQSLLLLVSNESHRETSSKVLHKKLQRWSTRRRDLLQRQTKLQTTI